MDGVLGPHAVKHVVVVGLKQDRELAPEMVHAVEMHNKQIPVTYKVAVSSVKKAMVKKKIKTNLHCLTYSFRQFRVLIEISRFLPQIHYLGGKLGQPA